MRKLPLFLVFKVNNKTTFTALTSLLLMKKYYLSVRALHMYIGLLTSPFIFILAISVLVINHPGYFNNIAPVKNLSEINTRLDSIPFRSTDVLTAKAIIQKLSITGEIDFISKNDSNLYFPVSTPRVINRIRVNTLNGMVSITRTDEGALRGMKYLHIMPGPHNFAIRGNSGFIKVWRYIADTIVYSLLFLSFSGVFLWYFMQSERKAGIYAAGFGLLALIGLLLLIF
jgi:hypothetical protein